MSDEIDTTPTERIAEIIARGLSNSGTAREILSEFIVIPRSDLPEAAIEIRGELSVARVGSVCHNSPRHLRAIALRYLAAALAIETSAESYAAKKLNQRRDELAREFGIDAYDGFHCGPAMKRAIDRIIKLEDAPSHE